MPIRLLILFLSLACSAFAQESPAPEQLPAIERQSLNGTWSANHAQDQIVEVPGTLAGDQKVLLSRKFTLPATWQDRQIFLVVQGINHTSLIRINEAFVSSFQGGASSFRIHIKPELLKIGSENEMTIEIDRTLNAHTTLPALHRPMGWHIPYGVLRDIYFEAQPAHAVTVSEITPDYNAVENSGNIAFTLRAQRQAAAEAGYRMAARIVDLASGRDVTEQQIKLEQLRQAPGFRIQIPVKNVKPWSPQQPSRYALILEEFNKKAVVSRQVHELAFRKVEVQSNVLLLNGQPFKIRGISWHENLDGLSGDALTATIKEKIALVQQLGANTIRIVGRPAHPELVRQCSQAGLFVLQEIPVYYLNAQQLATQQIVEQADAALRALINRDAAQPAALAWGLAVNSDDQHPEAQSVLNKLAVQAHAAADQPVYMVSRSNKISGPPGIDFVIYDLLGGRELPAVADKPLLPMVGAFVNLNEVATEYQQPDRRLIEAEEIQAQKLERQLSAHSENQPGIIVQGLQDWRGLTPLLVVNAPGDSATYPLGLLRLDGKRRISFDMVQAHFKAQNKPHISPNPAATRHPALFMVVGVCAMLIFLFFLNRDRRLSGNMRRVFVHPHGFYMDLYENRKVAGFNTTLIALIVALILGTILASTLYAYRQSLFLDEIINLFVQSLDMKARINWLIWAPGLLLPACAVLFLVAGLLLAGAFKLASFFRRHRLPIGQYIALVTWTAVCYLPLALLAPVFYRILLQGNYLQPALFLIAAAFVWHVMRLTRGARVLFALPAARAFVLVVGLLGLVIGSVLIYYNYSQAIFAYFDFYLRFIS